MQNYRENNILEYDDSLIDAIDSLFDKSYSLGLVDYKIAFEDRLDAINQMLDASYKSGLVTVQDFNNIEDPADIIDTISIRKKLREQEMQNNTTKEKKSLNNSPSLKEIFRKVKAEMKKPGNEQDEKVYFEAGKEIGSKLDTTARKISSSVSKTVKKIFKRK